MAEGIPPDWLVDLHWTGRIREMAGQLRQPSIPVGRVALIPAVGGPNEVSLRTRESGSTYRFVRRLEGSGPESPTRIIGAHEKK